MQLAPHPQAAGWVSSMVPGSKGTCLASGQEYTKMESRGSWTELLPVHV